MGYTNYWKQPTDFTVDEWCAVKNEAEYLKNIGNTFNVGIYKDEIIINGNNEGCESFDLNRLAKTKPDYAGQDITFNYCKTRELPYDLAVWHLLTFCQMIKKDFECSRDGWAWEKNPQPTEVESDKPLAVKFKSNDYCENNELPFDQVKYFQMFGEDNEDGSKTTWVRFKLKNKLKGRKANGFITAIDNVLNMEQVKDNVIRRLHA